jgi:type IV secretion system protein VirB9
MRQLYLLICLFLLLPSPAFAADRFADLYFQNTEAPLTPSEREAMKFVQEWKADGSLAPKPVRGANGDVQFVFGASQPSILCAVLQVTDVQLEPGEQVNSLHFGDSARWSIEPAITGYGAAEMQHLIIKPRDVGLETSLIVTTNRRSYHMTLKSTKSNYMPKVSFIYPDAVMAKWDALQQRKERQIQNNTIPESGEYLGDLDFGYDVAGKAAWKPLRVFNDGVKTIIQMPRDMQSEAPTLLVVRNDGGFFSDGETVMVNYRLQGDRYIVDTLFDKAILIAGVGKNQDKVTITRSRR